MDYVYVVKQEWYYYGDYDHDYNTTVCASKETAMRIFDKKKLDSIKNFKAEIEPGEVEDEFEELSDDKWYYRIYKGDDYYECYEEVSVEKKEVIK